MMQFIYFSIDFHGRTRGRVYQENSVTEMVWQSGQECDLILHSCLISLYRQTTMSSTLAREREREREKKYRLCCILIWWMLKIERKNVKKIETLNITRTCKWKSKATFLLHSTYQFIHLDERRNLLSHRKSFSNVVYKYQISTINESWLISGNLSLNNTQRQESV